MKKCPNCFQKWPDAMQHCPKDGAKLAEMVQGPLIGHMLADKYHIIETLGEGASGTVYKAKRAIIGDHVAVKTLRPELVPDPVAMERFRREAQASGRIRHPNAIAIYDFGAVGRTAYLVMEMLTGRTLREVLRVEGALSIKRTVNIFLQVCGAVQRAHRAGVIHRDLKPENIMLEEFEGWGETVKVIDFGLAKLRVGGQLLKSLTEKGRVAGTPYYMSPEQWQDRQLDDRADVYALGVMLYEALTGKVPFDATSIIELARLHVQQHPVSPQKMRPALDPSLEKIILKAMAKKREERYQSAMELALELRRATGFAEAEDELSFQLRRVNPESTATKGAIAVHTRPGGCHIYLNEHLVGTSDNNGVLTVDGVPSGEYAIAVGRAGYQEWQGKLTVEEDTSTVIIDLVPRLTAGIEKSPEIDKLQMNNTTEDGANHE
jgi:eukaryotic-like serine/threonine-protein kinase